LIARKRELAAKVVGTGETWITELGNRELRELFALSTNAIAGDDDDDDIEVFRDAGTNLFPAQRDDLVTSCTCPDWGDPCRHVAAAHHVLGEALDHDPFLLFALRGRTRAQVLGALRLARTRGAGAKRARGRPASAATAIEPEIPGVTLGALDLDAYDRPRAALPALRAWVGPE
jgi:hypothetical protein